MSESESSPTPPPSEIDELTVSEVSDREPTDASKPRSGRKGGKSLKLVKDSIRKPKPRSRPSKKFTDLYGSKAKIRKTKKGRFSRDSTSISVWPDYSACFEGDQALSKGQWNHFSPSPIRQVVQRDHGRLSPWTTFAGVCKCNGLCSTGGRDYALYMVWIAVSITWNLSLMLTATWQQFMLIARQLWIRTPGSSAMLWE